MKYKGILLATASGVALAPAANAADLPSKAPAYVPPPAPISWTGFYVGAHLGANWQMSDATYAVNGGTGDVGTHMGGGSQVGFIGGGQIGYNWQVAPTWVLGVEGSFSGLTGTVTSAAITGAEKGNGFESRIDWIATLRGRVGWLMHPDTMIYGTGGAAWAKVKSATDPFGLSYSAATLKSASNTKTGWVAGGGMEHMFNRNWSVAIEALYYDFGKTTGYNDDGDKATRFKNTAVSATVKVNYRF